MEMALYSELESKTAINDAVISFQLMGQAENMPTCNSVSKQSL